MYQGRMGPFVEWERGAIVDGGSKAQKILLTMFRLSSGTTKPIDYDDLVVETFRTYRDDFCLRKYPQYPDASDIHKPLYGPLKQRGLVRGKGKQFSLTDAGLDAARSLLEGPVAAASSKEAGRLTRSDQKEIARICSLPAFELFQAGKLDDIVDSDFYYYIGATVRTDRGTFQGRVSTVAKAVNAARLSGHPKGHLLEAFHQFMMKRFDVDSRRAQGAAI